MSPGNRSKTSRQSTRRADDMARAFELKLKGYSLREIAKELGCCVGKAHALVVAGIKDRPAEALEEWRTVELDKLDASERRLLDIIAAHIDHAAQRRGDYERAATVVHNAEADLVKVRAARAKILGLEAKQQFDVSGSLDLTVDARDQLLDRLARLASPGEADPGGEEPEPG